MLEFNEEFHKQVEELYTAILSCPPGSVAGMAAPQIGINKRFFFAQGKLFVNPTLKLANGQDLAKEGCFSSPEGPTQLFRVWRRSTVWIKYQDYLGKWQEERFNGFMARVIQHEADHINGVLCMNREQAVYGLPAPTTNKS